MTNVKFGRELCVGDVIEVFGLKRRITRLEPYSGPIAYLWNGAARIATWDIGATSGMTIDPDELFEIF